MDFDFNLDELAELLGGNSGDKRIDVMHEETEREIERTRKRLAAEYKQAQKEMQKKLEDYYAKYKSEDKKRYQMVQDGLLSPDDYHRWRKGKIAQGKTYNQQVDVLAQHMVNADKQARDIVHHRAFGIYANNYNYAKYEVEKGLKINTSFTLFDQKTVERLASKNPKLLPDPSEKTKEKIREKKIAKWSKRKINNAIMQGVLQGEPIDRIAKRLEDVTRMGWNNAVRNARTAMTGAQNAGRFDSYKDSKKLGIKLKKQWMATLDERTRTSHQELDGELAEVDKKFSNGLMFPADPEGKPAEVYNCRCTMVAELDDYPSEKFERLDNIPDEYGNKKPIENCTYKEWAAAKAKAAGVNAPEPKSFEDKIKAIKNNPNLSDAEKIEQAGQIFADEMNNGYLKEMQRRQDEIEEYKKKYVDPIQQKWDMTDEERSAWDKYVEMSAAFNKDYAQENISKALAETLSKVRSVGLGDEKALRNHLFIKRATDTSRSVMHAYEHYPTDWVKASMNRGFLHVQKVDRGYYSDWRSKIAISGWNVEMMRETAFHELGHRFEKSVSGILKAESEFYKRRTAGESLEWLGGGYGKDEVARRDKFLHAYMGKDYGGAAYELVSMGFEYAYTNPAKLAKDPDMQRWIYGMLCVL